MELIISSPTAEGFIKTIDWNHEEIKAEITEKVEIYKGLVYDEDQVKEAKADRAELNKFKKAIEDKRKEVKQQCLAPYENFEKQVKEIIAIIDEPVALIDSQVKAFEERQKQEKEAEIKEYFESKDFHGFTYERLADPKWLNAGTSMKSIKEAIDKKAEEIAADFELLNALEEYTFEAIETYKNCGDVRAALAEAKRLTDLAKQKAEWEAKKAAEAAARAAEAEARAAEAAARKAEEEARQAEELQTKAEAAEVSTQPEEEMEVLPFGEDDEDEDFVPDFEAIEKAKKWYGLKIYINPEELDDIKEFFNSRNITCEVLGE